MSDDGGRDVPSPETGPEGLGSSYTSARCVMFIFSVILNVLLNSRDRQAGFLRARQKDYRRSRAQVDRARRNKGTRSLSAAAIASDEYGPPRYRSFPFAVRHSARSDSAVPIEDRSVFDRSDIDGRRSAFEAAPDDSNASPRRKRHNRRQRAILLFNKSFY